MRTYTRPEKQVARELKRKSKAWEKNRIEDIITIELAHKLAEKEYIYAIPFIKPFDTVKKLGTKAQSWLFDEIGKLLRTHRLQPEIDIFFKEFGQDPTDIRFPKFHGIELKYFAPRTGFGLNALYNKSFYAGLDEALGLLTLGLDSVSLWHFFDNDMLNKHQARIYAKMVRHVICTLNLPIGYRARWVEIDKGERKIEFSEFRNPISKEPKTNPFLPEDIRIGSPDIIVEEIDPFRLSVIRRALGLATWK